MLAEGWFADLACGRVYCSSRERGRMATSGSFSLSSLQLVLEESDPELVGCGEWEGWPKPDGVSSSAPLPSAPSSGE